MKTFFACLFLFLTVSFAAAQGDPPPSPQNHPAQIQVTHINSAYAVAPGGLSGTLTSGQAADVLLSGIDFDRTGGGLLFNHPRGLASDGTRLILSDGSNNRILIWNSLPTGNQPPDLVLGQPDFDSNAPGTGLNQLNWVGQVSVADDILVAADTNNARLLIWTSFPTRSGQPADRVINGIQWTWGVWIDGTRLVATATGSKAIHVWNTLPTRDDQPADFTISGGGIGTPRTITSDGTHLIVGDHNAFGDQSGDYFWSEFPTGADDLYDFFMSDPNDPHFSWMQGDFLPDGGLMMLGRSLSLWGDFPTDADDRPDLVIDGYRFRGGDGNAAIFAGGRVYVLMYNGNSIVGYNALPTSANQQPDFAVGSPDIHTNTLDTHHFITNPVPATDGAHLFVISDFDRRLYVYRALPNQSGAYPDLVYDLPFAPWDSDLHEGTLVLGGGTTLAVWKTLPLDGELPDTLYAGGIGSVRFQEIRGVAWDGVRLYVADARANRVYGWDGLPMPDAEPSVTLPVERPARLSSNTVRLAITQTDAQTILVYGDLAAPPAAVGGMSRLNRPYDVLLTGDDGLMVADTNNNRVLIWHSVDAASASAPADVMLGGNQPPQIGRDTLYWAGGLAFDGSYLWVGEFKFSHRLLRFSIG
ncbi:MAG: hypothetical protein JNL42_14075 [Anaerolineae bacterium]|nr:hypothetical protein [Anaerolineae bacterium]